MLFSPALSQNSLEDCEIVRIGNICGGLVCTSDGASAMSFVANDYLILPTIANTEYAKYSTGPLPLR